MTFPCDHDATCASIESFRHNTMFVGFQNLLDGRTALMGQCRGCQSSITVEIVAVNDQRHSVVRGQIETTDPAILELSKKVIT